MTRNLTQSMHLGLSTQLIHKPNIDHHIPFLMPRDLGWCMVNAINSIFELKATDTISRLQN
jgi:hypothetical protein